jgi:hypothetical protein
MSAEILLRPASEVPEIFVERLQTGAPAERAVVHRLGKESSFT